MTPQTWHLTIPRPAQWLNLNQRQHWSRKATATREWRWAARVYAQQAKLPKGLARVKVNAWLRFEDRRKRDAHNYMPTLKACVDGLVDYGLVADDNDEHLVGPLIQTGEPHRPGLVLLMIEEVRDGDPA